VKAHIWNPTGRSKAEELAQLPEAERHAFVEGLTPAETEQLLATWEFWARPKQRIPWHLVGVLVFLCLAGRGFGKTRMGAEATLELVRSYSDPKKLRIGILGPTTADCRDVMIEGESGLLSCLTPTERRGTRYEPSRRLVTFWNGARAKTYTAEEPERLRGPQHHFLWVDEPATYRHLEKIWDLAVKGLRLGDAPKALFTGTPLPHPFFYRLLDEDTTVFINGTTWENAANIPEKQLAYWRLHYEGTDLGRQELEGQLLGENPGALWRKEWLDAHRVAVAPELRRIIVAIDPSSSKSEDACECGIIVAGLGTDGCGYVLADYSTKATAAEWVRIALKARLEHKASAIIYEGNHGGGYVWDIFRLIDSSSLKYLSSVQATTDKEKRATPIAAMTQKGLVRMVGTHRKLEEQLCTWIPRTGSSPDRLDAMTWAFHEFFIRPPAEMSRLEAGNVFARAGGFQKW